MMTWSNIGTWLVDNIPMLAGWIGTVFMYFRANYLSKRLRQAQVSKSEIEVTASALAVLKSAYEAAIKVTEEANKKLRDAQEEFYLERDVLKKEKQEFKTTNGKLIKEVQRLSEVIQSAAKCEHFDMCPIKHELRNMPEAYSDDIQ